MSQSVSQSLSQSASQVIEISRQNPGFTLLYRRADPGTLLDWISGTPGGGGAAAWREVCSRRGGSRWALQGVYSLPLLNNEPHTGERRVDGGEEDGGRVYQVCASCPGRPVGPARSRSGPWVRLGPGAWGGGGRPAWG